MRIRSARIRQNQTNRYVKGRREKPRATTPFVKSILGFAVGGTKMINRLAIANGFSRVYCCGLGEGSKEIISADTNMAA
jgi:hypothetical protein